MPESTAGPAQDLPGEIVNVEAAEAWNGRDGAHWVRHRDRYDEMLAHFTPYLLEAAGVSAADQVLDIGCGSGQTTCLAAQAAPDGGALGVDLSKPLLAAARVRAGEHGLSNARFDRGDAQVYPFAPASFDVAISRNGVMFFADPIAAFTNIAEAVRPDGRLAFLCWQAPAANEWITGLATAVAAHVDLPPLGGDGAGAFSLADPEYSTALLGQAGFTDITVAPLTGPLRLGADLDDVTEYLHDLGLIRDLLAGAGPSMEQRVVDTIRTAVADRQTSDGIHLGAAVWLVTATRRAPTAP